MAKIEPEEEDFDPETFSEADAGRAFAEGIRLFDAAEYHAAHEEFEKCWLANESADADFYKGLIQASICLYHFQRGNLDGARKLYSGHRKLLAAYMPEHRGLDVARLLVDMQRVLRPVLRSRGEDVAFDPEERPVLLA